MAKAGTIKKNEKGYRQLIQSKIVTDILMAAAGPVKAEAESTAVAAELGSKRLAGYASAGFSIVLDKRTKRQRILVVANAPQALSLRVHFATQKANGIGHLRQVMQNTKGIQWPSKR